jgi:hypothetical protein
MAAGSKIKLRLVGKLKKSFLNKLERLICNFFRACLKFEGKALPHVSIMVFHSMGSVYWPNFIENYFEEKLSDSNTLAYFMGVLSDGKIRK